MFSWRNRASFFTPATSSPSNEVACPSTPTVSTRQASPTSHKNPKKAKIHHAPRVVRMDARPKYSCFRESRINILAGFLLVGRCCLLGGGVGIVGGKVYHRPAPNYSAQTKPSTRFQEASPQKGYVPRPVHSPARTVALAQSAGPNSPGR